MKTPSSSPADACSKSTFLQRGACRLPSLATGTRSCFPAFAPALGLGLIEAFLDDSRQVDEQLVTLSAV